eukprot:4890015-Prymnesium_polylepis.1
MCIERPCGSTRSTPPGRARARYIAFGSAAFQPSCTSSTPGWSGSRARRIASAAALCSPSATAAR